MDAMGILENNRNPLHKQAAMPAIQQNQHEQPEHLRYSHCERFLPEKSIRTSTNEFSVLFAKNEM